jgi:RNA polymerase sigma-70 factor (ECF subfamily)
MHKKVSLNCRYFAISPAADWDWAELRHVAVKAAAGVLGSSQDAEDAAHEAVVRAWRARSRCAQTADPRWWVARIAQNEASRMGGRISRRRCVEGTTLDDVAEPTADRPPPERADTLIEALQNLTERDRELVALRYVEDLQYSIIAERLDLPLGTVKVRLHRLHAALRQIAPG